MYINGCICYDVALKIKNVYDRNDFGWFVPLIS